MVLPAMPRRVAHFPIGSGTKLAMEDAIQSLRVFPQGWRRGGPLDRFEIDAAEETEKTQHAADVSLVWFGACGANFWNFHPVQFAVRRDDPRQGDHL